MAAKQTLVLSKSMDLLRENGYLVDKTEYFVSRPWQSEKKERTVPGFRKDLLGFLDAVGIHFEKRGLLGLQVTTATNVSARLKKAEAICTTWRVKKTDPSTSFPITYDANHLEWWLRSGNRFQVHGWRKSEKRNRWVLTIREVKLEYFEEDEYSFMWWKIDHLDQLYSEFKQGSFF